MRSPVLTQWKVRDWLVTRIAEVLRVPPEAVSTQAVFSELGLSSVQAVELATELEDWCGYEIPATFVYECPTIEDAAHHVMELSGAQRAGRR